MKTASSSVFRFSQHHQKRVHKVDLSVPKQTQNFDTGEMRNESAFFPSGTSLFEHLIIVGIIVHNF
jgi:hypothetical protein